MRPRGYFVPAMVLLGCHSLYSIPFKHADFGMNDEVVSK